MKERERLLDTVHDFVAFDAGIRKVCRHNQCFGVRTAYEHLNRRGGGIIWHAQGSARALTMVWLAKWTREHVTDARVLITTDPTQLDEQIEEPIAHRSLVNCDAARSREEKVPHNAVAHVYAHGV